MSLNKQPEDFNFTDTLLWAILPLSVGLGMIYWGFCLKEAELVAYRSSTPRIILFIAGSGVAFISICILTMIPLAKICAHFGWDYTARGSRGNNFFSLGFLILCAPLISGMYYSDKYNNQLELDALKQHGKKGRFMLEETHYVPGKGARYEYYFQVADLRGQKHRLDISRKGNTGLYVGDSVSIVYLPANPTVFREEFDFLYPEQ